MELEIAAKEQMKITELRIAKLFSEKAKGVSQTESTKPQGMTVGLNLLGVSLDFGTCPHGYFCLLVLSVIFYTFLLALGDRLRIIGGHLNVAAEAKAHKRSRPPITTHVLDVSRGAPAVGVEVHLEVWNGATGPSFRQGDGGVWSIVGTSATDKDGRSGPLMDLVEALHPGTYRISFNTGKYCPGGFFPYVSIAFEVTESQKLEHFHVPLLLSPFSFTTYRGS